jgi:hypothetical protein
MQWDLCTVYRRSKPASLLSISAIYKFTTFGCSPVHRHRIPHQLQKVFWPNTQLYLPSVQQSTAIKFFWLVIRLIEQNPPSTAEGVALGQIRTCILFQVYNNPQPSSSSDQSLDSGMFWTESPINRRRCCSWPNTQLYLIPSLQQSTAIKFFWLVIGLIGMFWTESPINCRRCCSWPNTHLYLIPSLQQSTTIKFFWSVIFYIQQES